MPIPTIEGDEKADKDIDRILKEERIRKLNKMVQKWKTDPEYHAEYVEPLQEIAQRMYVLLEQFVCDHLDNPSDREIYEIVGRYCKHESDYADD